MINRRVVIALKTYYYRYLLYPLWYFDAWCITCCWGISAMFAGGGVRFHTAVVFLIQYSCSCLSYLFMVSPDVVGIGSEYFVGYLSCIYVRLIMSGHLLFRIYFNVWYITCCPKWEEALEFTYKVIGGVLVLGLLVVVYKIPYCSCMWTRQDVIGVFPSYYCLSGITCVPVIVQYISTSLLLLST